MNNNNFIDKTKFKGPRTIYSKSFKDYHHELDNLNNSNDSDDNNISPDRIKNEELNKHLRDYNLDHSSNDIHVVSSNNNTPELNCGKKRES